MKVHILDDWFDTLRHLPSFRKLHDHDVTIWTDKAKSEDVLVSRLADAEAVVLFRDRTAITATLLARLPKLKLISQRSSYGHIDIEACARSGVTVCSNMSEGRASIAAAELTFTLLLAAARRLPDQLESLQAGTWQAGVGQSLAGRKLGLYGYGKIAKQVAKYARAFDMEVWWWASEEGRARARSDGETVAPSREAFFAQSDAISLHVRATPTTRGIISGGDLSTMKPGAIFINTSRAALLAKGAIEMACDATGPGRICLDVFDREPMSAPVDAILSHPKIIATPHIGFVTEDELDFQFNDIYDQIVAFAQGAPIHVVTS
ncbi:D-2-hydroxyacid dehydrogenase family protein [Celeribacter arenosi]|uniref:D-2-hydroxyacid dehydrogenase family protein n=1 Tax=Celeribacter arenosi TaxID=792649 RepID=A0ABP7K983_9RHOB